MKIFQVWQEAHEYATLGKEFDFQDSNPESTAHNLYNLEP